jgi:H/ACA ribonucleoprotein complex subunit 3
MTESLLRICRECRRYTLKAVCPACGGATRTPHPARFSPGDRYGKYRRLLLDEVRSGPGPRA